MYFQVRDNINITLSDVDTLFIEIPKEELHSNKNVIEQLEYVTDLHTYAFVNLRKK